MLIIKLFNKLKKAFVYYIEEGKHALPSTLKPGFAQYGPKIFVKSFHNRFISQTKKNLICINQFL